MEKKNEGTRNYSNMHEEHSDVEQATANGKPRSQRQIFYCYVIIFG